MIRHLLLALALAAGVSSAAQAQTATVTADPGKVVTQDGQKGVSFYSDPNGRLYTTGGNAMAGAGGISTLSRIPSSAAGTNLTTAKAAPGRVYTYQGCNTTASTVYLRVYNAASTAGVTVGTTVPFAGPYAFPANTCVQATPFAADIGLFASVGITYAFGTAPTDTDATAIAAGAVTAFQMGVQ